MSRLGNIGGRLHRGEVSLDFVGRQKTWYTVSGLILVVSIVSLLTLGLNFGVEFKGGTVFQFPTKSGATTSDARAAVKAAGVVKEDPIVQKTGTGWRVQTETLTSDNVTAVQRSVQSRFGLAKPDDVSPQTVGASWGKDISKKALEGLIVFLIAIVDLPVHRLRVADGGRGPDRARPRHPDHHRRLLARPVRGDAVVGGRPADHPRLLPVRHRGGVRQGAREHPLARPRPTR